MKIASLFKLDGEENAPFVESDNTDYLNKQVIMYMGRKKSILNFIEEEVTSIKKRLGKNKLTILDGFSGSGIVCRLLKKHSSKLYANDLEYYSLIINQCYLTNKKTVKSDVLEQLVIELNSLSIQEHEPGFIEELYSPKDTMNIRVGERAFFTNENAKLIDNIRREIDIVVPKEIRSLFIAPLLASLNGKANVQNVFRAFYKDSASNKGQWGGNNPKLYGKMFQRIFLELPVLSDFNCDSEFFCRDINELVRELPEMDLAYFDPPFDQYAYGENYFMYNIIAKYERPIEITNGAGVPLNWNRSIYNSKKSAESAITDLIENTKAKFILLTYNENGLLSIAEIQAILERFGVVVVKSCIRPNSDVVFLFTLEKSN